MSEDPRDPALEREIDANLKAIQAKRQFTLDPEARKDTREYPVRLGVKR